MKKTYLIFCFTILTCITHAQKPLLQWAKNLGGTGSNVSNSICTDIAGNVYIAGNFSGTTDFDPGTGVYNLTANGNTDGFVAKLSSSGNLIWAKSFGGTGREDASSIAVDASGNIYTTGTYSLTVDFDPGAGTFNLSSNGFDDMFLLKLDGSGNFAWAKSIGGTDSDYGYSVALDGLGNIHVTGNFSGTVDFDPNTGVVNLISSGFYDFFISKFDGSGNLIWAKGIGGTEYEYGSAISIDGSGNVFVTGDFSDTVDFNPSAATNLLASAGLADIFVLKLDANGNYVWAKNMGGSNDDFPYAMCLDASGNIYTTGSFNSSADFDPNAGTALLNSGGSSDIFISKLDAGGNFIWAKGMSGPGTDFGYAIKVDAAGNVYTSGSFSLTVDFDPGAATFNLTSAGNRDAFISKLDPSGNFIWAKKLGGSAADYASSITLTNSDIVYTSGRFSGTVDFDPNTGVKTLTSSGPGDAFIHRMLQCNLKVIDGNISGSTGGNIILYEYIQTLSKWDSIAFTPYSSAYSFGLTDSSSYVLKAVPTATNEQVTYSGNAVSWQGATVINHGCMTNSSHNISVASFTNIGTGTGSLSGKIVEAPGFGQKSFAPGNPIGGIIVKGGRNPGGQMFAQTTTDEVTGTYTLSGLPNGSNYFILVDIPGLDTNLTYHVNLLPGDNQLTGLDFTVDSIYVNPIPNIVGLNDLNSIEHHLQIFPNPTSEIVQINYDLLELSLVEIELLDITGRHVKTLLNNTHQHGGTYKLQFQLSNTFSAGLYFIKLKINSKESVVKICISN